MLGMGRCVLAEHLRRFVAGVALAFSMATTGSTWAATDADKQRALELFRDGAKAYDAGRFEKSVQLLRRAYQLDPAPVLLYNLARAYESMGAPEQAADNYKRFLQEEPNAQDRGAIEKRIEILEAQVRERAALKEQRRAEAARAASPSRPRRALGDEPTESPSALPWIVAGAGLVTLAVGGYFGLTAQSRQDEAVGDPDFVSATDKQTEAEDLARTANILFIAGGVLSVSGVVWGVLDLAGSGGSGARESTSLSVSPGLGAIQVRGTF